MHGWLIDTWRSGDRIGCWIKTSDDDRVVHYVQPMTIYAKPYPDLTRWLEAKSVPYAQASGREYDGSIHRLIAIRAPVRGFERFVSELERAGRYRTPLFDADVTPEQRFLIERDLYCGCTVRFDERRIERYEGSAPALRVRRYTFIFDRPVRSGAERVVSVRGDIEADGERETLEAFKDDLERFDPDVLVVEDAHAAIPIVDSRMRSTGEAPLLHRFDPSSVQRRDGRSLFRYGSVVWRDARVELRGRLLFTHEDIDGMIELSRLSGARLQTIASRSPGAVFQQAIVRRLIRSGCVVSFKGKPLSEPMSMSDLIRSDRAGLSFDPLIGFHPNVVELDYEAMFPNLMVAKNISAERIGRGAFAPDVPVRVDTSGTSIVSETMRPFVELRARYKHGNERERERARALKGILVSANGYLRFREFKLGIPTSHVALCAWAREYLLRAKELAEEDGFRLIHGIVDSIYLQGDTTKVEELRARITHETGLPIACEGVFKWIVFLASRNDPGRPVITRFFGVFTDGSVKLRGIEARQKSTPHIVSMIQSALVSYLGNFESEAAIRDAIPRIASDLSSLIEGIRDTDHRFLACSITLSKERYTRRSLQRDVMNAAQHAGVSCAPGQRIRYVHTIHGPRIPGSEHPIAARVYARMIVRAVSTITAPFGYDETMIATYVSGVQQRLDRTGSYERTLLEHEPLRAMHPR